MNNIQLKQEYFKTETRERSKKVIKNKKIKKKDSPTNALFSPQFTELICEISSKRRIKKNSFLRTR